MKLIITAAVLAAAALSLTGCAPAHATITQCENYYLTQLYNNKDRDQLEPICTKILQEKGQAKFDELYGDADQ